MRAGGVPAGCRIGGGRQTNRVALTPEPSPGRLLVGTSGFAYAAWSPRFYPPGLRAPQLLPWYAGRFPACELNNTFYQRPTPAKVAAWLEATPPTFRFAAKAQRGASFRALGPGASESVPWLVESFRPFGDRLGAILFRVPADVHVDLSRLDLLLAAWPREVPLALEFEDASWQIDEVLGRLREAGAALCATERPEDPDPPTVRLTGSFLYLRLRRHDYSRDEVDAWADRISPFLAAGTDVFAFFRHDEVGRAPELADALREAVADRASAAAGGPVPGAVAASETSGDRLGR